MDEIQKLKDRLAELHETSKAIQAKADADKRDLSVDEQKELDAVMAEFDEVEASIKRRERILAQESRMGEPQPRATAANPVAAAAAGGITNAATGAAPRDGLQNTRLTTREERQRWGFNNMGEFAISVRNASIGRGMDPRLQNAALSTYGSEGVGGDGGFAVPPEWRTEIMKQVDAEDGLLSRTDQQTITSNNITYPTDETSAWQTTGGIQVYWDSEAAAINQSKPALKDLGIKLHRLTALVPVTEELLEDAPAMSGYVTVKAGEKIAFKLNDAIVNGTGVGQPLGILKSPCLVTQAAEGSQTADTVHAKNVQKMVARMPASSFSRSVWLINQDVWPEIMGMGNVVTNAAGTVAGGAGALWMPPTGMANSGPFGSLLGRPVIVTEACQALGDVGDIVLGDLSKYLSVVRGAIKSDVSIHLWFDQNAVAFRFVLRMNGQPWLSSAIARKNGSNTLSHFVALAAR